MLNLYYEFTMYVHTLSENAQQFAVSIYIFSLIHNSSLSSVLCLKGKC